MNLCSLRSPPLISVGSRSSEPVIRWFRHPTMEQVLEFDDSSPKLIVSSVIKRMRKPKLEIVKCKEFLDYLEYSDLG